jgi:hypothetical protein
MFACPLAVRGQTIAPTTERESRIKPWGSELTEYGMPERLKRQVAPTPSESWRVPDLSRYTDRLKSAERSPIDPDKSYSLLELIDIAESVNPETRIAWEGARQAAIKVGLVESEYEMGQAILCELAFLTLPLFSVREIQCFLTLEWGVGSIYLFYPHNYMIDHRHKFNASGRP